MKWVACGRLCTNVGWDKNCDAIGSCRVFCRFGKWRNIHRNWNAISSLLRQWSRNPQRWNFTRQGEVASKLSYLFESSHRWLASLLDDREVARSFFRDLLRGSGALSPYLQSRDGQLKGKSSQIQTRPIVGDQICGDRLWVFGCLLGVS